MLQIDIRLAITNNPPAGRKPVMMKCKVHQDDKASLAIYPDGIYCFGCPFRIQNTLKALSYLMGKSVDIEKFMAREPLELKEDNKAPLKPLPLAYARLYHRFLYEKRAKSLTWLSHRGLSDVILSEFLIGHDGLRYTLPILNDQGELLSIRYRRDDLYDSDGPKYCGMGGRNRAFPYPEQKQHDLREWRLVTESELCAIRLWQEDIPSVTTTNGAGNLVHLADLLKPYPHIKTLYLAQDMDRAGNSVNQDLYNRLCNAGYEVHMLAWPVVVGKDVTEVYQHGEGNAVFGYYRKRARLSLLG